MSDQNEQEDPTELLPIVFDGCTDSLAFEKLFKLLDQLLQLHGVQSSDEILKRMKEQEPPSD